MICSELSMKADKQWARFSVSLRLPYWWPSTTAAVFRTQMSSVASCMEIDNVSLSQLSPGATPSHAAVEVTLVPLTNHGLHPPKSAVQLLVASNATEVDLKWRLHDPAARLLAQGTIGAAGAASIPLGDNASGALLLNFVSAGGDFIAPLRLMVGAPAARIKDHLETFSFSATPQWPDWQLIAGSDQLATQLAQLSALGLNTLHYYLGVDRMTSLMSEQWVGDLMEASKAAGIAWLMTLDDRKLFVPGFPTPTPGNVTTDAQLALWSSVVTPFVKEFCDYAPWFEVLNVSSASLLRVSAVANERCEFDRSRTQTGTLHPST